MDGPRRQLFAAAGFAAQEHRDLEVADLVDRQPHPGHFGAFADQPIMGQIGQSQRVDKVEQHYHVGAELQHYAAFERGQGEGVDALDRLPLGDDAGAGFAEVEVQGVLARRAAQAQRLPAQTGVVERPAAAAAWRAKIRLAPRDQDLAALHQPQENGPIADSRELGMVEHGQPGHEREAVALPRYGVQVGFRAVTAARMAEPAAGWHDREINTMLSAKPAIARSRKSIQPDREAFRRPELAPPAKACRGDGTEEKTWPT